MIFRYLLKGNVFKESMLKVLGALLWNIYIYAYKPRIKGYCVDQAKDFKNG